MRAALFTLLMASGLLAAPGPAEARVIERACLSTDRAAGNRALCGCIQGVANRTLSGSDQRKAARFFSDPERAQQVRMSRRATDRAFWERYRAFGDYAEAACARR